MAAGNHHVYPPILRGPELGPLRADERRVVGPTRGVRETRAGHRARLYLQDLTWMFAAEEAAIFAAWWANDLNYGTKWFIAVWPLPQGWKFAQRKMIATPHWAHLGNGAWRVSVTCEVRLQPLERIYYTSRLYPLDPIELLEMIVSVPVGGYLIQWPIEELDVPPSIPLSGTLVSTLQSYNHVTPELLDVLVSTPQSGTLVEVLVTYNHNAPELLDVLVSTPLSGTLVETLVTYSHSPEEINIAPSVPVGGTLV
jgi:hypothetical protein